MAPEHVAHEQHGMCWGIEAKTIEAVFRQGLKSGSSETSVVVHACNPSTQEAKPRGSQV
jgi:hypothetical protein